MNGGAAAGPTATTPTPSSPGTAGGAAPPPPRGPPPVRLVYASDCRLCRFAAGYALLASALGGREVRLYPWRDGDAPPGFVRDRFPGGPPGYDVYVDTGDAFASGLRAVRRYHEAVWGRRFGAWWSRLLAEPALRALVWAQARLSGRNAGGGPA